MFRPSTCPQKAVRNKESHPAKRPEKKLQKTPKTSQTTAFYRSNIVTLGLKTPYPWFSLKCSPVPGVLPSSSAGVTTPTTRASTWTYCNIVIWCAIWYLFVCELVCSRAIIGFRYLHGLSDFRSVVNTVIQHPSFYKLFLRRLWQQA